ncbi:DUF397 domain-containing protein [Nocardia sp. CDC186]|uniref:DUF397 domain-containing protein n=1 Tax=Nocardia implantans TaxID=3108168 RepID=A0ABU6B0P4_9NOCA|nr:MULTISPECIES: DUF397 domain-containing protein [unclassified Nocardia]MBF6195400.1 DUF397 domain-containing protein [Nocardia beijingensis]MEA3532092.1 DUF397 domain-containing protein [Nocardia sp. CDC192]MEB3513318.1 DUF397 domain-containing protein [Nocardia sp. CDC186]
MKVDLSTAEWFKSTRSAGGSECVEVAFLDGGVGVRDSKNPAGPALIFSPTEWDAFTAGVAEGKFSRSVAR